MKEKSRNYTAKRRKRSNSRSYAQSSLDLWWRTAVKLKAHYTCSASWHKLPPGAPIECAGQIEAHHVVRRAKGVLRHDLRNGIALCNRHHQWADSGAGSAWVAEHVDMDYLTINDVLLPEYLRSKGLSLAEFRRQRAEELKAIIKQYKE
jgi:hypothetical protein